MSCLPIIHHDDLTTSDGLSGEPKAQPGPSSGSTPRRAAWAWVLQARPIYRDGSLMGQASDMALTQPKLNLSRLIWAKGFIGLTHH